MSENVILHDEAANRTQQRFKVPCDADERGEHISSRSWLEITHLLLIRKLIANRRRRIKKEKAHEASSVYKAMSSVVTGLGPGCI